MDLDRRSSRALYRQLADHLRTRIYSGELKPGTSLPSEHELREQYDTSRNTVRDAFGLLINEGLVSSSGRGGGYFVREKAPLLFVASKSESRERRSTTANDAWVSDVIEQGRTPRQEIEVSIVHPSHEIASRLGLEEKESAVARRRIRYVDEVPYALSVSYFPLSIVQGSEIVEPGDIERGANRVLAEIGREQINYLDQIITRMPTPSEIATLEMGAGTPIHEHVRVGYDADGDAIRVAVSVLPGDKHIIQYELNSA